ncbi:hypothetical protein [uncultured Catonella sp.]|uniref:hypothetical protein n=1 Tax=Peptoanaerobacter stomatis TaxID=796937 RepID=UPI0028EE47DB|nr:hypothetical protein [uncultured Catonella sp.]
MEKRKYSINETLFISESEEWIYITVDNKVYKVKLTADEVKNLYNTIKNIKNGIKVDENDRIFKFLITMNGIIADKEIPEIKKEIVISYVENIGDIKRLNEYCNETGLIFDSSKKGLMLYVSDNEIVISSRKLKGGKFVIPTEKQEELIVQTILKNKDEIITALTENYTIAIPVFSYVSGVRILKDKIGMNDVDSAICFQPWYMKQKFDLESRYPDAYVKCKINGITFEARGNTIDQALYFINDEFITIGESCYE